MQIVNDSCINAFEEFKNSFEKCYYCLRRPSIIPFNDYQYNFFLEKLKGSPYKICYTCWSILRSLNVPDESFFKFRKDELEIKKPRTAFKFVMIGHCINRADLISKAIQKGNNELRLEGFRNDDSIPIPVNLRIIESPELLIFLFDITNSNIFSNMATLYLQLSEIILILIDGKDLDKSITFIEEYNHLHLQKSTKIQKPSILLGLNFSDCNPEKRQKIVNLNNNLNIDQFFIMDENGNKKDSSIATVNNITDFLFFTCQSYLKLF